MTSFPPLAEGQDEMYSLVAWEGSAGNRRADEAQD
jgi:hypothetical protein